MLGFIIGVFTGSAVGVVSMCLMIAGKQADRDMERCAPKTLLLTDKSRCIQFVDVGNKEMFLVPDGGCIELISEDGERQVGLCRYLDDGRAEINGREWEMQTFAIQMEARGIRYAPLRSYGERQVVECGNETM